MIEFQSVFRQTDPRQRGPGQPGPRKIGHRQMGSGQRDSEHLGLGQMGSKFLVVYNFLVRMCTVQ